MRVEGALRAPESRSVLRELREGWTEFRSRAWVWMVVAGFAFVNAASLGAVQILGPAVADDTVGRRAWGFALAFAPATGLLIAAGFASIGSYIAIPFAQILLGPIAAATGIDAALAGCGVVIWIAVAAMLAGTSVRRLDHRSETVVVA